MGSKLSEKIAEGKKTAKDISERQRAERATKNRMGEDLTRRMRRAEELGCIIESARVVFSLFELSKKMVVCAGGCYDFGGGTWRGVLEDSKPVILISRGDWHRIGSSWGRGEGGRYVDTCIRQESLYHNQSDPPHTSASKRYKKLVIGKYALNALIKSFTDTETLEQKQRWVRLC